MVRPCGARGFLDLVDAVPPRSWSSLCAPGLANATPRRVRAGRERMEIAVLRITAAGRKVLAGMKR
jgi:hypothetical protein